MCRFLQFAVDRTLDQRGEELKEYVSGVEVLDRSQSSDPRIAPIVRVEARRLRAKLKTYYESIGVDDGLIVSLPTGCYPPVFPWRQSADAPPAVSPPAANAN